MGSAEPAIHLRVRALRRVRVLVGARDRRFIAAATFVLTRRGFAVESAEPGDVLAHVERTAPNVVVLDGTEALARAGRTAAAIEGDYPGTCVLLVSENDHDVKSALPKWDAFAHLIGEIERVYGAMPRAAANGGA
jgi:hypothetical protein